MAAEDKPLVWLRGEVKTPRFTFGARIEAGVLLRRLQRGENLSAFTTNVGHRPSLP